MIDKPGRENPRFPTEFKASVRSEIKAKLDAHNAGFGYASAACGSDILFLELMLKREAEIQVILPFEEVDFLRTSVDLVPGAGWESRFHHVLERAAKIIVVDEATDPSNYSSYECANLMIEGLGQLRANTLDTDLKPLFVWDGQAGDGPGGTHSQISRLHAKGYEVEVVDIAHLAVAEGTPPAEKIALPTSVQDRSDILDQRIIPMLFADVVGYTRLKGREVQSFVEHFLGNVADLITNSEHTPIMKNTWAMLSTSYFPTSEIRDSSPWGYAISSTVWPGKNWVFRTASIYASVCTPVPCTPVRIPSPTCPISSAHTSARRLE